MKWGTMVGLLWTLSAIGTAAAQLGTPNPILTVRDAPDYKVLGSLFPQAGTTFDPDRDYVMGRRQQERASEQLTNELEVQKSIYTKQAPSILASLATIGVRVGRTNPVAPVKVDFQDDQVAWSHTLSPTEIRIGARLLRGMALGSLHEAVSGEALLSLSLASLLDASRGTDADLPALEARARLFFAAARNGRPVIRTEEDFREQRRAETALLDGYLKGRSGDAPQAALEDRLRAAAGGGDISGVDGMIMFDVFMRLNAHYAPAQTFVLSHELGHVVLDNAPFPLGLSCRDRQAREDEADAFAIALLVYDVPGEGEASASALRRMGIGEAPDPSEDRLAYGYGQAVRYGFALSGLDNLISPECGYRRIDDRIALLDGWRAKLVERRASAIQEYFAYFKDHPPFVHTSVDVDGMTGAHRFLLADGMYAACHAGRRAGEPKLRKVDALPFGWVIACPNDVSAKFMTQDFRDRIGEGTWRDIVYEYGTHLPRSSLMDETASKALSLD